MCKWIEVPIFCNTDKTARLKDLGLDPDDSDFEVRFGKIDTEKIVAYYPDPENKTTIINVLSGSVFELDLPYKQFDQTINKLS